MSGVYLLLGGNLGDRRKNLFSATNALLDFFQLESTSSLYESAAWGISNQPNFYNQVLRGNTLLSPAELLSAVLNTEQKMGRVRLGKWQERVIDIDILYYNDQVIESENLSIPHPHISERRFTLTPLAEISPGLVHPVLKKSQAQLLNSCTDPLKVSLIH